VASYTLDDNDLIQTNLEMTMNGQRCMNTFHWVFSKTPGSPTDGPTTLGLLNDELESNSAWFYHNVQSQCTMDVTYEALTSQKVKPSRWHKVIKLLGTVGANAGPTLPQNSSISISRWGLISARGNTGRVQLVGVATSDTENGLVKPAAITGFAATAASLYMPIHVGSAGTFYPVLAKMTASGFSVNEIVGATVQDTVRVMRRRTVRVGI